METARHEKSLKNMNSSLEREKETLRNQQDRVNRLDGDIRFMTFQIECAKKEKKDGFDEELYKKKFRDDYLILAGC